MPTTKTKTEKGRPGRKARSTSVAERKITGRFTDEEASLVERAAAAGGVSTSAFMRERTVAAAKRVLAKRQAL